MKSLENVFEPSCLVKRQQTFTVMLGLAWHDEHPDTALASYGDFRGFLYEALERLKP